MIIFQAVEKVLAGAIRREMALEEISAKQTSEIMQLNRLVCLSSTLEYTIRVAVSIDAISPPAFIQVQQYKHERECNTILSQTREDKIARLESLMDGILPTEEFMEEEFLQLTHEHKVRTNHISLKSPAKWK